MNYELGTFSVSQEVKSIFQAFTKNPELSLTTLKAVTYETSFATQVSFNLEQGIICSNFINSCYNQNLGRLKISAPLWIIPNAKSASWLPLSVRIFRSNVFSMASGNILTSQCALCCRKSIILISVPTLSHENGEKYRKKSSNIIPTGTGGRLVRFTSICSCHALLCTCDMDFTGTLPLGRWV